MGKRILCVNIFTLGHQGALAPQFSKTLANFEKLLLELSAARKGSKPYMGCQLPPTSIKIYGRKCKHTVFQRGN